MTTAPFPGATRRRVVVLASTVVLLDATFFSALTPMLPYYADRFDLSDSGSGILSGAYAAGTLAGSLPSGRIATHIGPRNTVIAGVLLMSLTSVVFAIGDNVVLLDLARFVQGLAGACSWLGAMGWVLACTPVDRRGSAIGQIMGLGFSGALLGPLFGAVARAVGPHAPFLAIAALGVLLAVPARRMPAPRRVRGGASLADAFRHGGVRAGMALMLLPASVAGSLNVVNPLRMDALGASGLAIGATFLAAAAVQAVGQVAMGRLTDRVGRRGPILVALCAGIALLLLLPLPRTIAVLAALVVAATASLGVIYTPATALVTDGADAIGLQQALGLALVNLTWAGGQAAGALSAGAVAESAPEGVPYVALAAISALAAWILLWRGASALRGRRPAPG